MLFQPTHQFEERGNIGSRLQPARHPLAEINIDHPSGYGLPEFVLADVQIFDFTTAESTLDPEPMFPKKGMKWIPHNNFTLVTGIIVCRL
jgi:hypothetical protein